MAECRKTCRQRYSGIGGQAVLEGVMMRSGDVYAVSVRRPDGTIVVDRQDYPGFMAGSPLKEIPFVRGVFVFIDSMILGMRCINYSASFFEEEEEGAGKEAEKKEGEDKKDSIFMGLTLALSFALAIGLFFILPFLLSSLAGRLFGSPLLTAVLEGLIRIAIFLAYMVSISAMEDINRLYRYHGAEHKCINCIESGLPLTVENARGATRFHKRCGSSFIVFVMMVSIVLFFFIRVPNPVLKILLRLALIPVISGISFELIRLAGSSDNPVIGILSRPGLWFQRLTVLEPDDSMLEVAISSVESVFDWRAYLKEEAL